MRNALAKKVMDAVTTITEIHNKQVAPLLTAHHRDITSSKEDIQALYELVEMYFFVLSKAMATGVFDKGDKDSKNLMAVMNTLDQMQDHYLACVAIHNFFRSLKNDF